MATYDLPPGNAASHPSYPSRTVYVVENVVDLALVNSDAGTAAADVLQVLDIPAETIVLNAGMENIAAITGASCPTFDLQTGATANKWVNASTKTTTGYHTGVLDLEGMKTGFFSATDTIDILINTGTTTVGKIRVFAVLLDVSGHRETSSASQSQYDTAV